MNLGAVRDTPHVPEALSRLHTMARQRPVLNEGCQSALKRHATASVAELERWADAVMRLAYANAGPTALIAVFDLAAHASQRPGSLSRLAETVLAAAEVCRAAGAAATRLCLQTRIAVAPQIGGHPDDEAAWWRALTRAAREAPDSFAAILGASATILDSCGGLGFEAFVATGLRASADPARRAAFFGLIDPEARRVLDRLSGRITFSTQERRLQAYVAALWGTSPPLRGTLNSRDPLHPRAAVSAGIIYAPETVPDLPPDRSSTLFRAIVAHASAHLAFDTPRRDPGQLKPVQIALVGLVEDARIERLAIARLPGLRRLWAPFHTVEPSVLRTVPELFARLARALFDSDYEDHDGFVSKGRALFSAEPDLADPALSRRIGGLLGNDIGQMRIQFNAKLFVIEPPYRDDNLGFWDAAPPPPDAPMEEMDLPIEAMRPRPEIVDDPNEADRNEAEFDEQMGRARSVAPPDEDAGVAVARYPEWDGLASIERPDWTTVHEVAPRWGSLEPIERMLARDPGLSARIEKLVRIARAGRPRRLKRQPDGVEIDLEAAIDAAVALRAGKTPDDRLHLRKVQKDRDLATLILIDTSESTRDRLPSDNATILDIEKYAVAVLAEAMAALGDRFVLRAFASDGRENVRIVRVKDVTQSFDRQALARLSGLSSGLSTRLGAALRHAGAELQQITASRRLLLVLTDGAPADIDAPNADDLVEDARRAVLSLRAKGIDTFGLTLDPSGEGSGSAVFGRSNHMPIRRIAELPQRLSDLYFRISRR